MIKKILELFESTFKYHFIKDLVSAGHSRDEAVKEAETHWGDYKKENKLDSETNTIMRIWETGYLAEPKYDENNKIIREENPLMGYCIHILLDNGERKEFFGTDIMEVQSDTIRFLVNTYNPNQPLSH